MITDQSGGEASARDSAESVTTTLREVELDRVVAHPANPRKNLGDLDELEESIREQGVLQPAVLLPATRVAAAWPQHAGDLAGAEFVVLMGHRRHAACRGVRDTDPTRATMPAMVRTDAIADDPLAQLDAMCAENIARQALTPLEEARAFAEQVAAGRSQRAVAARVGCSQSRDVGFGGLAADAGLDGAFRGWRPHRNRTACELALMTGMRIQEWATLLLPELGLTALAVTADPRTTGVRFVFW